MWLWINGEVSTVVRHKGYIKGWSLWKSIIGCGKENPFLMGYEEFFKKEFNEQYGTVYKYVHMCIVMNVLFW